MDNPAIKRIRTLQKDGELFAESEEKATYQGVVQKELLLLAVTFAAAGGVIAAGYVTPVSAIVTSFMALIIALVICFNTEWAAMLSPAYAILEGMAIGSISYFMEYLYPNIVIQAVMLTFSVALIALFVFGKGLIKVDSTFAKITSTAILAVLLFSIGRLIGTYFFGINFSFFDAGLVGIGINLLIIGIATMSLFVDYERIKETVELGLPKEYEWFCAFSLLVTLIWLYLRALELLRSTRK